jgi:hypothetical protein
MMPVVCLFRQSYLQTGSCCDMHSIPASLLPCDRGTHVPKGTPHVPLNTHLDVLHALHELVDAVAVQGGGHVGGAALLLDGLALSQQLGGLLIVRHDALQQQLALVGL